MDINNSAHQRGSTVVIPEGITAREARYLLEILSRLKAKRFGRVTVTVSDGRLVDVELVEKVDRNVLKALST